MTLYSPISSIYCSSLFLSCRQHMVSFCFTLINVNKLLDVPDRHISTVLQKDVTSPPNSLYSASLSTPPWWSGSSGLQTSCILTFTGLRLPLAFRIGLGEMKCSHWGEGTNRQRLQMEFAQWSEIPIQKIDFVHKLEFEVSKGRITQVLHQVSAILWLLAPGAGVWVTDYTTAVSGPSYFCTPASPIHVVHIHMSALSCCSIVFICFIVKPMFF